VKLDTKEKYDAWVARKKHCKQARKEKGQLKVWLKEHGFDSHDLGHGRKADHHERFVDIKTCFPPKYL
jgi:hypothetical protein